jgi:hypothetical protein
MAGTIKTIDESATPGAVVKQYGVLLLKIDSKR